jgi:hypothetical protein
MSEPLTLDQTRDALRPQLRNRFGAIPADLLLEHLLEVTSDADFPVRKAAVEALLRRRD